ncbi:3-phenylpropionate/cinnamic acid dioxygenase subunit beta [Neobacillus niacini]|uniref:3-phenylpropionate/cinnamic acid dioxygenase subunit beta n=1 Tax=Neobacillus niacini TaxID=86668 RepID=UPI0030035687
MNSELHYEISNFLNHEAFLLDHNHYNEWLDILSVDIKYRMPLRVTTNNKGQSNIVNNMTYFEETKSSLISRVARLYTSSAWAENPATRQRHIISNVMIESTSNSDEYQVRSYILFLRSRGSDHDTEKLFGERLDIIRKENSKWKLIERTIYPDQAVLTISNMSMFL